ncbi:hypothetical protein [Oscillibacter ruminantium]|nr:hypothetical protein [Oscillibacter valericigenes]
MGKGESIVEDIIRSYPELAEKMRSLKYSISSSHGKDPTACAAAVKLPAEDQRRYNAILSAIRHTSHTYHDAPRRLLVIQATYWGDTAGKTALLGSVSYLDAEEYRKDFIEAVSQRLGLNDCAGCIYYRRLFGESRADIMSCLYCYDTGRTRSHDGLRCFSKSLSQKQSKDSDADQRTVRKWEVLA